ncbi:DUF2905 domain-containing protein [Bacillaceae bacterium ZC4]|jgi:Protein of unknown function (DUF2905).|uniref:Uncharacterized protein n=1 Tax=Aeribacillus pallidus TaxID=33936 RepID=A0A165XN02_9BACI|nr:MULTISPECIES: DUF2905 domain-containing protein [Aeribacillus]AXI40211.1 DUF2905 domain-containing protein [Bacillaceae bacterium ZC4]ASS92028.1 hypothetical protein AP3564_18775 [Aeribacillus pallidus]KZM54860.1 hypothetical protein A3Q35_12935 [Aeribacillus pallidus]KZN96209.1 hypothetical protein AZI98_09110 [Aeribacillus pallidus]MDR9791524.1 DUF2905 domain-containing protein [Aeribacillus pallidus]
MTEFPKLLMVLGGILLFIGLFMQVVGRLPGDIVVKKGNFTFFFPIVTCIVISLLLTFIFSFLGRFK